MIAAQAVSRAVHAALAADAELVALLGGPHVHEFIPARARLPYVSLAIVAVRDWSTATEGGAEVEITATTWSEASRLDPLAAIQARVAAGVTFERLTVPGHALVNVHPLAATIERRPADGLLVGRQPFRIVCEPDL